MSQVENDTVVKTSSGILEGVVEEGVVVFRGVPYAAPVNGENRFCPPQPFEAWDGIRASIEDGPIPPQRPSRLARVMGDFDYPYDENCLTLNIWTPGLDKSDCPVVVWIHGGAFVSGAGSLPWYNGAKLAGDHNLVVVSVNYRLGALGFLYHPEVSAGNLGLRDQVAALEWVKSHIAAFGGVPDNVTLMGQSAGAISAYALLANTHARDLFQRVILQSGRFSSFETPESGSAAAVALAEIAGVGIGKLKSLQVEEILDAQSELARQKADFAATNIPILPIIDDDLIPENLHEAAVEGAKGKEVMLGSTHDEMYAFLAGVPEITGASDTQVEAVFKRELGDKWLDGLNFCRNRRPGAGPLELLSLCLNETNFAGQTAEFAERLGSAGISAWLYRFDWFAPNSPFGACHCIELPFVFNTFDKWQPPMIAGIDQNEAKALARTIQKTWANFARNGDPNHEGLLQWPAYNKGDRSELRWGRFIEVVRRPEGLNIKFFGRDT